MANIQEKNVLVALSDALADAVAHAAVSTVAVEARERVPASGVAYSVELVLTANHAIEREDGMHVLLPDGSQVGARLVGRDPGSDLALLRLDQAAGVVAERAEGEAHIGQLVLALGRPGSEGIQASQGIISAIGGPVQVGRADVIQRYLRTDAIPYPGFSGGPLIDAYGRVVGINTTGLIPNVSLTIPAALAWNTAATLERYGRVRRGYLGVRFQPVDLPEKVQNQLKRGQKRGLMLVGVEPGSAAESGGLMIGDVLISMGGKPVEAYEDLIVMLGGDAAGNPTSVELLRGGMLHTVSIRIGER